MPLKGGIACGFAIRNGAWSGCRVIEALRWNVRVVMEALRWNAFLATGLVSHFLWNARILISNSLMC